MTFPTEPRQVATELFIGGSWVDVSADVYTRDPIRITGGKSDRSSQTSPGSASLSLQNGPSRVAATLGRTGCYSPRNPLGPYSGQLMRNTPIRIKLRALPAPAFDVQTDSGLGVGPFDWNHFGASRQASGVFVFIVQSGGTTVQTIDVTYGGVVVPLVRSDATNTNGRIYTFYLGEGVPKGSQFVHVQQTLALQLFPAAVTVTGGNATELNATPAAVSNTNANPSLSASTTQKSLLLGVLHSGQDAVTGVAAGTGYTDVREVDFGTDTASLIRRSTGTTTSPTTVAWTATADTWTAVAYAVSAVSYRFWGETSDLPGRWDDSGRDSWTPIVAGGILRRINQGDRPILSTLRDYLSNFPSRSYWPMDEGESSTTGINLGAIAYTFSRDGVWIVVDDKTDASAGQFGGDLQPLSSGFKMTSTILGFPPRPLGFAPVSGDPGTRFVFDYVYRPDLAGNMTFFIDFSAGVRFAVVNRHNGTDNDFLIQLSLTNQSTGVETITNVADSDAQYAQVDYQLHHVRATFDQVGADVAVELFLDGVSILSGTTPAVTITNWDRVMALFSPQLEGAIFTIGHVALWDDEYPEPDLATTVLAAKLWSSEMADDRFARLCTTAEFPYVIKGSNSLAMGQQGADYFSNQLTEIEATDFGFLYEPRDQLAVAYRTHTDLFNQTPVITASYSGKQVTPPLEPTEDDSTLKNDVFAQRRNGGSFQATKLSGPLSVNAPPLGAGRYKDEVPVNVESDGDLPAVAGWLIALGTVNEPRFPRIRFNLAQPAIAQDPALADGLLNATIGDKIAITGTGVLGYYDGISQLMLGYDETLSDGGFGHVIDFNCMSAAPYEVAEFDDGVSRFDPGDTTVLNAGLTTMATTVPFLVDLLAAFGTYAYWTTNAAVMPIPIMVSGEEMSVTAIAAGAAGVQNATVVRSVNGVVKTHSAGEQVTLKRPTILAL